MEYSDFKKYFPDFQICYVHDNFKYVISKTNIPSSQWKFFIVSLPVEGKYFFTVHQKTKRMYPSHMHNNFKYGTVTMLLG